MAHLVALTLWVAVGLGFVALWLQAVAVWTRSKVPRRPGSVLPAVSILKPLCGDDDALAQNLESFAALDYPAYEVLLGVQSVRDAAYPVARRFERDFPQVFRVVVQDRPGGLNPKVAQLMALGRRAAHRIWAVSDSNVRVAPGYLSEIAACLEDPRVGCVTHPVVGDGHRTLGSLLDNFHLASSIAPGMIASMRVAGKALVVGKSMAFRREDLRALGGFEALRDYLAEDYVFGLWVGERLRKDVVIAATSVVNVSCRKTVDAFLSRYFRWSVIHRTAVKPSTYLAQTLLNPLFLATAALVAEPSAWAWALLAATAVGKSVLDLSVADSLAPGRYGLSALLAAPLKDVLLAMAWVNGLVRRTVTWRGNRLVVGPGSRLVLGDEAGALLHALNHVEAKRALHDAGLSRLEA